MGALPRPAPPGEPGQDRGDADRGRGRRGRQAGALRRGPPAHAGRDPALPGEARRRMGHRDRPEGGSLRQASRIFGVQPPVPTDFRRAGLGPQLDEGVSLPGSRRAPPAPRLAPLLRGSGARPGRFGDGDRHHAAPAPGGGSQVRWGAPHPRRVAGPGLGRLPTPLRPQAAPLLRRERDRAGGRRRAGCCRHGLPPLRAPAPGLRAVHPAHGVPTAPLPRDAPGDGRLPAVRIRARVRAGRPAARRGRVAASARCLGARAHALHPQSPGHTRPL